MGRLVLAVLGLGLREPLVVVLVVVVVLPSSARREKGRKL